MTNVEKIAMLSVPYWNNTMIQEYFGIKKNTACVIIKKAVELDGFNPLLSRKVKRDSVFLALELDVNTELRLLHKINTIQEEEIRND